MVTVKFDGGSAFPRLVSGQADGRGYAANTGYEFTTQGGMSLRDWFAGQAMAGVISNSNIDREKTSLDFAKFAYNCADAMLIAREAK